MPKNIKKCNLENPSLNQPLRLRYMSKLKESNTKNPKSQNKKKRKEILIVNLRTIPKIHLSPLKLLSEALDTIR